MKMQFLSYRKTILFSVSCLFLLAHNFTNIALSNSLNSVLRSLSQSAWLVDQRQTELEQRKRDRDENAARIVEIAARVRHCSGERPDHVLCATPDTALQYAPLNFIPSLRNPCVCLSPPQDPGGPHILPTSTADCRLGCLPYVYLVGFNKCGSSSLHYKLLEHQQILGGYRKEIDWWIYGKYREKLYWERHNITSPTNLFAYMEAFDESADIIRNHTFHQPIENQNEQPIILESSVSYAKAKYHKVHKGIHHLVPRAKVLYIIRDPIERLFSSYRFDSEFREHNVGDQTPEGFHRFIAQSLQHLSTQASTMFPLKEKFTTSQYIQRIQNAFNVIGPDNMKVVLFEEYIQDPVQYIRKFILPFLDIPDYSKEILANLTLDTEKTNPSKMQYSMLNETRDLLQNYYRPFNVELSRLLGDEKWRWGY